MYAKGSFLNGSFSNMYGTPKTYLILGVTRMEQVEERTLFVSIYRRHSFSRTQRPDLSLLISTPSLVNMSAGMFFGRREGGGILSWPLARVQLAHASVKPGSK